MGKSSEGSAYLIVSSADAFVLLSYESTSKVIVQLTLAREEANDKNPIHKWP